MCIRAREARLGSPSGQGTASNLGPTLGVPSLARICWSPSHPTFQGIITFPSIPSSSCSQSLGGQHLPADPRQEEAISQALPPPPEAGAPAVTRDLCHQCSSDPRPFLNKSFKLRKTNPAPILAVPPWGATTPCSLSGIRPLCSLYPAGLDEGTPESTPCAPHSAWSKARTHSADRTNEGLGIREKH